MGRLLETGPREIMVTLGEEGCVIANEEGITSIPARSVDAVDPTGAGDTFLGYFLASRANGASTSEAARVASFAASVCVQPRALPGAFLIATSWINRRLAQSERSKPSVCDKSSSGVFWSVLND